MGVSEYYKLDLMGPCHNLDFAQGVELRNPGGGAICSPLDAEVIVRLSGAGQGKQGHRGRRGGDGEPSMQGGLLWSLVCSSLTMAEHLRSSYGDPVFEKRFGSTIRCRSAGRGEGAPHRIAATCSANSGAVVRPREPSPPST